MSEMESNVFFVKAKGILKSCTECGNPVPLTAINDPLECPSCGSSLKVESDLWSRMLNELSSVSWIVNSIDNAAKGKLVPAVQQKVKSVRFSIEFDREYTGLRCQGCARPIEAPAGDPAGQPFAVACGACGVTSRFEPPAPWLAAISPSLTHVSTAVAATQSKRSAAPIVMSCPACSGNLTVTPESKRLTKCEYCGASVHLPEEIWKEIHPVRKASDITLRFEVGPGDFRKAANSGCVVTAMALGWAALGGTMCVGGVSMIANQRQSEGWVGGLLMGGLGLLLFVLPGGIMFLSSLIDFFRYRRLASRFERA